MLSAASLDAARKNRVFTKDEQRMEVAMKRRPPLSRILSLDHMAVGNTNLAHHLTA